jgi:hypothetical protein
MTLYDASQSYGRANDARSEAMLSRVHARISELAGQFAGSAQNWKAIVIALALLTSLAAAEWFVTYCAFSNRCPAVEWIAVLPLAKLQFVAVP